MTAERYVVLALGPRRATWIGRMTQWAQSAAIPVELVKCLSVDDLTTRLLSRRVASVAILDEETTGLDRDLLAEARRAGCPTVMLARRAASRWTNLGATCVISGDLTREKLLATLREHAVPVRSGDLLAIPQSAEEVAPGGRLVAVTGPGGTGASTTAIALAQGLAELSTGPLWPDARSPRRSPPAWPVLLADLKRDAEQAVLHDSGDLGPGVQELVDSCRRRRPSPSEVVGLTFDVVERGYHLLLGLRRPTGWVDVPPLAFDVALGALQATYQVTVCDIDCDLEGEDDGGSIDVEERNTMARTVANRATAVVVVGRAGVKGVHSLARVLDALRRFCVPPNRLVPVVIDSTKSRGARHETVMALEATCGLPLSESLAFVHDRSVEPAIRDGVRLPSPLCRTLVGSLERVLEADGTGAGAGAAPPEPAVVSPSKALPSDGREPCRRSGATA